MDISLRTRHWNSYIKLKGRGVKGVNQDLILLNYFMLYIFIHGSDTSIIKDGEDLEKKDTVLVSLGGSYVPLKVSHRKCSQLPCDATLYSPTTVLSP